MNTVIELYEQIGPAGVLVLLLAASFVSWTVGVLSLRANVAARANPLRTAENRKWHNQAKLLNGNIKRTR